MSSGLCRQTTGGAVLLTRNTDRTTRIAMVNRMSAAMKGDRSALRQKRRAWQPSPDVRFDDGRRHRNTIGVVRLRANCRTRAYRPQLCPLLRNNLVWGLDSLDTAATHESLPEPVGISLLIRNQQTMPKKVRRRRSS